MNVTSRKTEGLNYTAAAAWNVALRNKFERGQDVGRYCRIPQGAISEQQ